MNEQLEMNKEILEIRLQELCKKEVDTELLKKISPKLYKLLITRSKDFIEKYRLGDKITEGFLVEIYNNSYSDEGYAKRGILSSSFKGFGPKLTSLIEQYFIEKNYFVSLNQQRRP